jgi:hypothetical protein
MIKGRTDNTTKNHWNSSMKKNAQWFEAELRRVVNKKMVNGVVNLKKLAQEFPGADEEMIKKVLEAKKYPFLGGSPDASKRGNSLPKSPSVTSESSPNSCERSPLSKFITASEPEPEDEAQEPVESENEEISEASQPLGELGTPEESKRVILQPGDLGQGSNGFPDFSSLRIGLQGFPQMTGALPGYQFPMMSDLMLQQSMPLRNLGFCEAFLHNDLEDPQYCEMEVELQFGFDFMGAEDDAIGMHGHFLIDEKAIENEQKAKDKSVSPHKLKARKEKLAFLEDLESSFESVEYLPLPWLFLICFCYRDDDNATIMLGPNESSDGLIDKLSCEAETSPIDQNVSITQFLTFYTSPSEI